MRSIGMDVHRSFAQVAIFADGTVVESLRIDLEHDAVVAFGQSLEPDDEVVLEATGNTAAIVRLLTPFVARVVIANPLQVKAIAHARVKTDKVDARILAQLLEDRLCCLAPASLRLLEQSERLVEGDVEQLLLTLEAA